MAAAEKTVEQLIAGGYEAGSFSDECLRTVEEVVRVAVAHQARKSCPRVADELEQRAFSHVWESLQARKFNLAKAFRPWCETVVRNLRISISRKPWVRRNQNVSADDWAGSPDGRPTEAAGLSISANDIKRFSEAIPSPLDRIIVAINTKLIDGLNDDLLRQWCEEAGQGDIVAALREISFKVENASRGGLKGLSEVLVGINYQTIRARGSRAMRRLEKNRAAFHAGDRWD